MVSTVAIIVFIIIPVIVGILFTFSNKQVYEKDRDEQLAHKIDNLLPQTQCGACGFAGCRPFADAIVAGKADINQCPPGGGKTILLLAELLGRVPKRLNPVFGNEGPPMVAFIDEQVCIGCVKCILACPVDAIIGAARQMHTVMPKVCTGCDLCIAPCPVNCISIIPAETKIKKFVWAKPQQPTYQI